MAEATAQLNTRIPKTLKNSGDVVLDALGLSATEVIRALWQYIASHQALPEALRDELSEERSSARSRRLEAARGGAGLALAVAREQCGSMADAESLSRALACDDARGGVYDEMLDEMEANCR